MKPVFDLAFEYTMQNEGGSAFTNDPRDSGGATKFGISKRAYEQYLGREVDISEIMDLTEDVAKLFYHEAYWAPLYCDQLTEPATAVAIFDTAVLYGLWWAARTAQEIANQKDNTLKLDGILGDKSRAAINQISSGDFLIRYHVAILARIELVVSHDPKNEVYRKGWKTRADRLLSLLKPVTKDV